MAEGKVFGVKLSAQESALMEVICECRNVTFGELVRQELLNKKAPETGKNVTLNDSDQAKMNAEIAAIKNDLQKISALADRIMIGLNKILNFAWGTYSMINYIAKNILPDREAHGKYRQELEAKFK